MTDAQPEQPPVIRVLSGHPTPEETAAIVAVLTAAGGAEPSAPPRRSQWGSHGDVIRRSVRAGHGNWVRSAHPHTSI